MTMHNHEMSQIDEFSNTREPELDQASVEQREFYEPYDWVLNPFLTFEEVCVRLRSEITRLDNYPDDWRRDELFDNIYLLGSALINTLDEYIRGPTLRLPRRASLYPLAIAMRRSVDWLVWISRPITNHASLKLRSHFEPAFFNFVRAFSMRSEGGRPDCLPLARQVTVPMARDIPPKLATSTISLPSGYRRLDICPDDILELIRRLVKRYRDRATPIVLVGLRTAGTYFAILACAYLRGLGFKNAMYITFQPDKGLGISERKALIRYQRLRYTPVILDDPPMTAGTLRIACAQLVRIGFQASDISILVPSYGALSDTLAPFTVIELVHNDWAQTQFLENLSVEEHSKAGADNDLPKGRGPQQITPQDEPDTHPNIHEVGMRGVRLKKVLTHTCKITSGNDYGCPVFAKSVGWGWLGYHAYLIGHRLHPLVPKVVGLRHGFLFTIWNSSARQATDANSPAVDVKTAAAYIAARVNLLPIKPIKRNSPFLMRHEDGLRTLQNALLGAYGRRIFWFAYVARLQRALAKLRTPAPTAIDGKLLPTKWIHSHGPSQKCDNEQHGFGKGEFNLSDPAYDLAIHIQSNDIAPETERTLLDLYISQTQDVSIPNRLPVFQLLAGIASIEAVQKRIFSSRTPYDDLDSLHDQQIHAWHALTVTMARFCGSFLPSQTDATWTEPIVFLDVDGVLDRRYCGFPATTGAGIDALRVFRTAGACIALNTARSAREVRDYCDAYGLSGGVGEHGAYMWDATRMRDTILIPDDSQSELNALRRALKKIPGIFLDNRYMYSIRACTYLPTRNEFGRSMLFDYLRREPSIGGVSVPIPHLMASTLIASLNLKHIDVHHTTIDTTFTAKACNKGTGLIALRNHVLGHNAQCIAVGDSRPDLAMFSVATKSYAPAHIDCAVEARRLGCQVVRDPYQKGLLQIAQLITNSASERFHHSQRALSEYDELLWDMLNSADRFSLWRTLGSLLSLDTLRMLIR